jgi:phage terminase small subunit
MALTAKQQRFVEEYLVDLNATQAAIRAGYSEKTAYSIGQENLNKPEIAAAVEQHMAKRSERTDITADKVLKELAKIGFADIRRAIRWYSNATVAAVDQDIDRQMEEEGGVRFAVANQVELVSSSEIDDDTAAAIAEIGQTSTGALKVKFHDKRGALVDIGRHLGMFKDRTVLENPDGSAVNPVVIFKLPDNER